MAVGEGAGEVQHGLKASLGGKEVNFSYLRWRTVFWGYPVAFTVVQCSVSTLERYQGDAADVLQSSEAVPVAARLRTVSDY